MKQQTFTKSVSVSSKPRSGKITELTRYNVTFSRSHKDGV